MMESLTERIFPLEIFTILWDIKRILESLIGWLLRPQENCLLRVSLEVHEMIERIAVLFLLHRKILNKYIEMSKCIFSKYIGIR